MMLGQLGLISVEKNDIRILGKRSVFVWLWMAMVFHSLMQGTALDSHATMGSTLPRALAPL